MLSRLAILPASAYVLFIIGNCQWASVAERGLRSRLNTGTGAIHGDHAGNLGCLQGCQGGHRARRYRGARQASRRGKGCSGISNRGMAPVCDGAAMIHPKGEITKADLRRRSPHHVMLPADKLRTARSCLPLERPYRRRRSELTGPGIFPGNVHHLLWSASRGTG
jgi:hypothetical protein